MALRKKRARTSTVPPAVHSRLKLSKLILTLEQAVRIFAKPLAIAALFIALAWIGIPARLNPWIQLVVLILFVALFFNALAHARNRWKKPTESKARRRVEAASGLTHRPLDVMHDRPFAKGADHEPETYDLWQSHVARNRAHLVNLRWPAWTLRLAELDRYNLRYLLLVLLVAGLVVGWGALGGRVIAAINPALGRQLAMFNPTLDAWITPPEYTGLPPIMIATPAGLRRSGIETIDVPEGSVISAHLLEPDGDAPTFVTDNSKQAFTADDHGEYALTAKLENTGEISIRRGWKNLGSWHIRIVADKAPQIGFTEPPSVTERKSIRLAYEASDDYGVTSVSLRVAPRESLPNVSNDPIEVQLAQPMTKQVKRVSFEDLTAHLWAGAAVRMTLIATDAAGHTSESQPVDFTLPERSFVNPVARILIDERKKLIQHADEDSERNDIANIMAGISHQPASYKGDPVVLMSLRAGAVRLVLDHSQEATTEVTSLLWQTAVRIEDGASGLAEKNLRDAQKDLADALDRNASQKEIQQLIDRLRQALAQYLSQLAIHMAARPGPVENFSLMNGAQTNMLTPDDLNRMLQHMRDLSASGARDAARQELSQLQQMLENLHTEQPPQLTPQQQQMLQALAALRDAQKEQQQLMDLTFRSSGQANNGANDSAAQKQLGQTQNELARQIRALQQAMQQDAPPGLDQTTAAMQEAGNRLQQGQPRAAMPRQAQALQGLQQAMQSLARDLRGSMMLSGQQGMDGGGRNDPFGRQTSFLPDDNGVKVPDQMQVRRVREILDELQRRSGDMDRSKTERDYIDRLLQDF